MDQEKAKEKWYFHPIIVVLLLFLVLGPLGLPLLYKSTRFNKAWKVVLTVLVVGYTVYLIYATIKLGLELNKRMEEYMNLLNQNQ